MNGAGSSLSEALGLVRPPELVALVGGGGKSSLMFALAQALPGRSLMTTTTRIFTAQIKHAPEVCSLAEPGWRVRLDRGRSALLVVGKVEGERALGVPAELPAELLAHPRVDWVLVEADGSRMRPVKAPAEHEPVVPRETSLLVAVAGIDALDQPLRAVAHRPELVAALTGVALDDHLTPETLAFLLASSHGGLKDAPPAARCVVLLNKVESARERALAQRVAELLCRERRIERVVIGALAGGSSAGWEQRSG